MGKEGQGKMDYKAAMADWAQQTDEIFSSLGPAGRKIVDAILGSPLTIDEIARLAELAGEMRARGYSAVSVLARHIEGLRETRAW